MALSTRMLALGITTGLVSSVAVSVAASPAGAVPGPATQALTSSVLLPRSPLGDDPKNRNGARALKVKLKNRPDGRIKIHWKGKGPRKNFKHWKIITAASRDLTFEKRVFHAKGKKRKKVVPHAKGVTPASGDYTFIKIKAKRKHGRKGGSSPTRWIQAPVTAVPRGNDRLTLATFNVRDANLDSSGIKAWDHRKANVFADIRASGAGIVNLQEASGQTVSRGTGNLYQLKDIEAGTGLKAVSDAYYPAAGRQGTRILYNPSRYSVVSSGQQLLARKSGGLAPWTEWAAFREKATGRVFYDISMHLETGQAPADEKLRQTQVGQVIALARRLAASGHEVVVAGDSNSTTNNKPRPLVHPAFMSAGFYDAFATRSISGQKYPTTNAFQFPVKPGPFRRDLILTLNGPRGSFWYRNMAYNSASQAASDHFLQVAQLPLG